MTKEQFKECFKKQKKVKYKDSTPIYLPCGLQTLLVDKRIVNSVGIRSLDYKTVYWVDVNDVNEVTE